MDDLVMNCPACGSYDIEEGGEWDFVNEFCDACGYDDAHVDEEYE